MRTVILRIILLGVLVWGLVYGSSLVSTGTTDAARAKPIPDGTAKEEPIKEGTSQEGTIQSDWPVFRGGMALRGYRRGTVSKSPKLTWTYDAETTLESTAAVVDGRLFIGTDEKGLLALNAADGKVLWSFPCEVGIRTSPGVSEGLVFFGDDEGIFRAVDATSGKLAWKFDPDTGAEIMSSASFYGDLVLFGSYDAYLYALSRTGGELRWKVSTEGPVHCTPAIGSGHTFVAGCDEQLRTISIESGKEIGAMPMSAYSAASPAVMGDRLFVGTFGMQVICVRWRDSEISGGKQLAPTAAPREGTGLEEGVEEGAASVEWAYEHPRKKFAYYSSPAVGPIDAPGTTRRWAVVVGGRDKMVHAIDSDSGESLWTFPTKAGIDGSPVIVGSYVIVGGLDGNIYCLVLATGEEHWIYRAGTPFRSSPAIADGNLYIAADEGLIYCFDLNPGGGESK